MLKVDVTVTFDLQLVCNISEILQQRHFVSCVMHPITGETQQEKPYKTQTYLGNRLA